MSEKGIHIQKYDDGNEAVVVKFGSGKIGIGLDKNSLFHLAVHLQELKEAKEVLSKSEHVDYLKGRVIKVHLYKDEKEFDARLYDRDLGAGAARAAIERYKRLGFF